MFLVYFLGFVHFSGKTPPAISEIVDKELQYSYNCLVVCDLKCVNSYKIKKIILAVSGNLMFFRGQNRQHCSAEKIISSSLSSLLLNLRFVTS